MVFHPSFVEKKILQKTLKNYQLSDPNLDPFFDDFALLASEICQTPIAEVVFTDSEKFWPKSTVGLSESEQEAGCCPHTISEPDFFQVPDTLSDERFAFKDWVVSGPEIRFYAGVPLVTEEGLTIGTICVMDREPRLLTPEQRASLEGLARLLIANLGLRLGQQEVLDESQKRKEVELALQRTLSLMDATLKSVTDGILMVDCHGKIIRYNQYFLKMWKIPGSVCASGHEKILLYLLDQVKDPERFLEKVTDFYDAPDEVSYDVFELKNGKVFERYSSPQWIEEKYAGRVWSFKDTTERHEQAALLRHRTLHDDLTNLPNRVLLLDRLQQAILLGRREMKAFAVLLMDLDRFKEVNDTLGHRFGDTLLKQVSARISSILRKSDTLARLGGDEFAVLLLGSDTVEDAASFAKKVLAVLEESFVIEGVTLDIGASIGITLFPDHGDQVHTLLQKSDVAMYMAKSSDTGIAVYSSSSDKYSLKSLVLKNDLRHAIQNEHLFLLYQPKVNLKKNCVTGVEALVRWNHPQFGIIPPDQFIGLSEQTGLIKPLTLWVLKTALNQSETWRKAGLNLRVAVNLSVRSLRDSRLTEQIVEALQEFGVPPEKLELEITESIIMDDPVRAMEIVTCLGKMGIPFALDDFGTGYSSLSYLKRLPISSIKIDKSFIRDMMDAGDDEVIVLSIIELAHNLGIKVIAEGVEDQKTWDKLSALRCDEIQGYFLSRPISGSEITDWCIQWNKNHPA